jgi:hypothetical protein
MKQPSFQGIAKRTKTRRNSFGLRRILLWFSHKRICSEVNVAIFMLSAEDKRKAFVKIEAALELISRFALHRIGTIRRQVKTIWVCDTSPYFATWQGDLEACVLDRNYVRSGGAIKFGANCHDDHA